MSVGTSIAWKKELVLRPDQLPPSQADWSVIGTFNPAAVEYQDGALVLVRVAERPEEQRQGFVPLPRWSPGQGTIVDWVAEDELEWLDPRVVRVKASGLVRLTFLSHLRGYRWTAAEGLDARNEVCRMVPQTEWETFGVEDPRITPLEGRYWITYVAVSSHGVATALASTEDFRDFTRHGIIFPPENKDVLLFPERIGGDYVALHRPNAATPFSRPSMWVARSRDMLDWGRHRPLYGGGGPWQNDRVGGGTPPIAVDGGWLEIYHGNARTEGGGVGCYRGGLMLLDREHPERILRRAEGPIMSPDQPFERDGFVPDVVFPTGIVRRGSGVTVFYGAADTFTATAETSLECLMQALE